MYGIQRRWTRALQMPGVAKTAPVGSLCIWIDILPAVV
jgi:hypothetical protein